MEIRKFWIVKLLAVEILPIGKYLSPGKNNSFFSIFYALSLIPKFGKQL